MELSIIEGYDSFFFFRNINESLNFFVVSIEKMGCYAFPYVGFEVYTHWFF